MTLTPTPEHTSSVTRFGYALSNRTRTQILLALREGSASSGDLAELTGESPQKVSNHLTCLLGCGLVTRTRQGRRSVYALSTPLVNDSLTDLLRLCLAVDPQCCTEDGCTCL